MKKLKEQSRAPSEESVEAVAELSNEEQKARSLCLNLTKVPYKLER